MFVMCDKCMPVAYSAGHKSMNKPHVAKCPQYLYPLDITPAKTDIPIFFFPTVN